MRSLRATGFAALALLAGCAGADSAVRYRPYGTFGDGAPPLHVQPLAAGEAEYQLVQASLLDPEATLVRTFRASGTSPVRVDLGRVRLRTADGEDVPLIRACVVATPERCVAAGSTRGNVEALAPGESLMVRADFGPLAPSGPDGKTPNPQVEHLTLVEDGILVRGRPEGLTLGLERVRAERR
jgi:hypothetical protein